MVEKKKISKCPVELWSDDGSYGFRMRYLITNHRLWVRKRERKRWEDPQKQHMSVQGSAGDSPTCPQILISYKKVINYCPRQASVG